MSALIGNPLLLAATDGYQISRSVRLRSSASAYFNRTFSTPTDNKKWTMSLWCKRGDLGTWRGLFAAGNTGGVITKAEFYTDDLLYFNSWNGSSNFQLLATSQVFRDPSAWYHLVFVYDFANATANNRARIYLNGTEITSFSSRTNPSTTDTSYWNNASYSQEIGKSYQTATTSSKYFDGYLTDVNFIDGQALTPSSFGETDAVTGVWKPKRYAGTYGTNGFYLNFSDNSNNTAATIGKDYSGNGNNWTPNNISVTSGATYDSMTDVPTLNSPTAANYAVLNPLDQHGTSAYATVAEGNLYWYGSYNTQNGHGIRSTLRVAPTGKWYVEAINVTYSGSGNSCMLGFTSSTQPITESAFGGTLTPWVGVDASVFNNSIRFNSSGVSASVSNGTVLFASYASNEVVNLAIDFSAGKIWIGKNGTWYNSGDPSAGTNATSTFTVGSAELAFWAEYVASSNDSNRSSAKVNFGQRPFTYTPPTGFLALNTQNLSSPTITNGGKYMSATIYSGSASQQVINSNMTALDFAWIKNRTTARDHVLVDTVRGGSPMLTLYSDLTAGEDNSSPNYNPTSISGSSITLGGAKLGINNASENFVMWGWAAGAGTTSSNTSGSITSTVSVNATAGFSVVTWTGTGSNATVGHGLGVAPSLIINKPRNAVDNWISWHTSLGATGYIYLNLTNASATGATVWNSTLPTSSVFSVGTSSNVNTNGQTMVSYCWAAVAGYSAFGSYTGNGSADGPFVYCGFRPRFVLFKAASGTAYNWAMYDSSRDTYNICGAQLAANSSAAEGTYQNVDFLSNGFKVRGNNNINESGATMIYAAFAENPFRYSLAR